MHFETTITWISSYEFDNNNIGQTRLKIKINRVVIKSIFYTNTAHKIDLTNWRYTTIQSSESNNPVTILFELIFAPVWIDLFVA